MTTIFSNLNNWLSESLTKDEDIHLSGFTQEQYLFSLAERVTNKNFDENIIIICNSTDDAEEHIKR